MNNVAEVEQVLTYQMEDNAMLMGVWGIVGVGLGVFHTFLFNRLLHWDRKAVAFALASLLAMGQMTYALWQLGRIGTVEAEGVRGVVWKSVCLMFAQTYLARPWLVRLSDLPTSQASAPPAIRGQMNIFQAYAVAEALVEKKLKVRSTKRLLAAAFASMLTLFAAASLTICLYHYSVSLLKLFVVLLAFKIYHVFIILFALKNRFLSSPTSKQKQS